ncbi:glycosyltransferase family 2 protein [Mariniflexile sp.]|uniref:glycosyltransferase family 2 protein n=1 Tax=Mariniflexile sp. TaxID=1979402 RepID=UPI003565DECE
MQVTIGIPTFNRLEYLKQAIDSCLTQTYKPFEIVISDDSTTDDTEAMVKELQAKPLEVAIRYKRNKPGLRQVKNVNQLFDMAQGEYIVLLHDDDLLHKETLAVFKSVLEKDPAIDIVFGKQYIINDDGTLDIKKSEARNKGCYRTAYYETHQLKPIEAGLLQQFPNDCYMLKSHIAKAHGYSEGAKDACDFEFALRLGINSYKIHFVNTYTAYYRLSAQSVTTGTDNDAALTAYQLAKATDVPQSSKALINKWMVTQSAMACMQAIHLKNKKEAWTLYFDPWHRKNILTVGGIKRFFMLLLK